MPGEKVKVTLGKSEAETVAGEDGRWQVTLTAQPVSKVPLTLEVHAKNHLVVKDILLGDIWLCGGQSNMEWALAGCDAPDDIRSANLPLIRQFGVDYNFANTPQKEVRGNWQICSPGTAPGFTAVGFYFARKIFRETGVPIGLLRSCVGGTNIELWMSQETLMNTPALAPYSKIMSDSLALYQKELLAAVPEIETWTKNCREQMKKGQALPLPPSMPEFPFGEKAFRPRCVTLHNGMIAPLIPFALRGALWYQGESNAGSYSDGLQYIEKKKAMVADWRNYFRDPNLPFYFVQLANWQQPNDNPAGGDGWAYIREAQLNCLKIPHTGMSVTTDIGDAADIHPHNKFDVGERLARWALASEYGQKIEVSGPIYKSLKIEGNHVILEFDHLGTGLMIGKKSGTRPTESDSGSPLKRFAIAGKDKKWFWAQAKIVGQTIVCECKDVPEPVAVRYAFSMNPVGANLYNKEGLPAVPFRTDNW
ncbi:hypothetical protein KIH39_06575 [Telmatocola sphagniphila]|uniref:Sialate O-acetylesterase domain-containing protein n=1 Tax=Telmatocola sphagniphila TaxID=1123043 RepID=A0A8E6B8Z2_9BACT|nr:sialate O-acetylesterase [Telmatocola sphagniphila]QVL33572.1 hypothetical protein KIH39_06575 [Telmatocola sphagniphila]